MDGQNFKLSGVTRCNNRNLERYGKVIDSVDAHYDRGINSYRLS